MTAVSAWPILLLARREARRSAGHFKRFATLSSGEMDLVP